MSKTWMLAAMILVSSDTLAQAPSALELVDAAEVPSIAAEADLPALRTALVKQAEACRKDNLADTFLFGDRLATREEWCVRTAEKLIALIDRSTDAADLEERAKTEFDWYRSKGSDGQGLVNYTAYNTPTLYGSATALPGPGQTIYARPSDLEQITLNGKKVWRRKLADGTYVPHFTREQIDLGGALSGQGLEIAWANDAYDLFILHIEGSGILKIAQPDGSFQKLHLHYDGSNGQPYMSLGRILREQGVPESYLTIPGMKRYFRENPEKMWPALTKNASYVFFKLDDKPPVGASDLALTPRHSIAIDQTKLPLSGIALLHTKRPLGQGEEITGWKEFTTLALSQDIGGAIQGAGRVDMYFGDDEYASFASGTMTAFGKLYFAVAKPEALKAIEPEPRPRFPSQHRDPP